MKKLYFAGVAALAALSLASCSNEDVPNPVDNGGKTTFSVKLPAGLNTRAVFGDGTTAKKLYVAVYEKDTQNVLLSNFPDQNVNASSIVATDFVSDGTSNPTATVTIDLVKNESYDIAFFAAAEGAPYEYSNDTQSITVNYENAEANDETRDAFYSFQKSINVNGTTHEVILYRPFAQVNIGTDDLALAKAAGLNITTAGATFSNVANVLNLATGTTSGDVAATFSATALPSDQTFPVSGYDYLSMAYILPVTNITEKQQVGTVGLLINGNTTAFADYINVPVQGNYRTNIYGSLLTNKETFEVIIEPAFEKPDYNVPVWDGTSTQPAEDPTAKTLTISKPSDLAGFAANVNNGNQYSGYTVTLASDLDLGGLEWTPIGLNSDSNKRFAGTFDGNGHTISNLTVNQQEAVYQSAGLFGSANATIKNLNVENASIYLNSAGESSDNGAAVIAGAMYPGGVIENCTVSNSTVTSNRYVGAIVGYSYGSANNNTVTNCQLTANFAGAGEKNDKVGGIVGYAGEGSMTFNNNTVNGCTMLGARNIGGIGGCINSGTTASGNTVENSFIYWTSILGNSAENSGSFSNGYIIGRPIGATLSNNTHTNTVLEKKS